MRRKLFCVHLALLFLATSASRVATGLRVANAGTFYKTSTRLYATFVAKLLGYWPVANVWNKQIILMTFGGLDLEVGSK